MATVPRIPDYGMAKQHDARTVRMFRVMEALDFGNGDGLMLSSGGDGDNGEMLMDLMDTYFKMQDGV